MQDLLVKNPNDSVIRISYKKSNERIENFIKSFNERKAHFENKINNEKPPDLIKKTKFSPNPNSDNIDPITLNLSEQTQNYPDSIDLFKNDVSAKNTRIRNFISDTQLKESYKTFLISEEFNSEKNDEKEIESVNIINNKRKNLNN